MVKYKSEWYEKIVIQVDCFFPSSKLCSTCGWKHEELTLAIRKWTCPECKTTHDRDVNASINILNEAIRLNNKCTAG
jgi:putative transposase